MTAAIPRRVLFASHTSEWIGPNSSLLELVIRLPESLRPVVALPGSGRFVTLLQEHGIPSRSLSRVDKWAIPELVRLIRKEEATLVYGNSAHRASRNALIAAKICNRPFVYHLREMAGSGLRHALRLFPLADAAIAVSRATADSYLGSFREPPRVIHNGVNPDRFLMDRAACREAVAAELGIDEAAPIIIQVGNLNPRKGQHQGLEVFRIVRRAFPECHMILAGRLDRDPAYVGSLRDSVVRHGLENRVTITGLRTDIEKFLAAADVFLHTAVRDPHPRAVVEAMASGLPVVAIAVDGVAETVANGETGFLVSSPCTPDAMAEPLARLLDNPGLRRSMGDRGRDRATRMFSADRTAREVAEVILELTGSL